jgi:hypothetical protein
VQGYCCQCLSPYAKSQILEDLKNIKYVCLAINVSNHIDLEIVPIIVRYFIPDKGIATEIPGVAIK